METFVTEYINFGLAYGQLRANIFEASDATSFSVQRESHAIGQDILAFSPQVFEIFNRVRDFQCFELQRFAQADLKLVISGNFDAAEIHTKISPDLNLLAATIKAEVFFIRSYLDAIYRFLLRVFQQKVSEPGQPSLSNAVAAYEKNKRNNNLALQTILTEVSDFCGWFRHFRNIRNEIKEGSANGITSQATSRGQFELSVIFQDPTNQEVFEISTVDLGKSLGVCASITNVAVQKGKDKERLKLLFPSEVTIWNRENLEKRLNRIVRID